MARQMDRTYWVAVDKLNGIASSWNVATPRLYLGRQAAIASKRKYNQTDEHVLERYDIIEVKVVPTNG